MKKSFKLISLLLSLVFLIAWTAACGSGANTGSTEPSGSAPTAAAESGSDESSKYKGVEVNVEASQIGPILIAKKKGWFEEEFARYGASVQYQSLPSSTQFLEAIASNRLDFARVGYIGAITGQAANVSFLAISEGSIGGGDGILVPKGSPIQSVKDLKGKKIAVTKGSSSWGLLLRALKNEGLSSSDVNMINLQSDEAQAAFQGGNVDAWVVWEPNRSYQVNNEGAKVIADAKTIGASTPGLNIVRTSFAEQYPELAVAYLKAYQRALDWQNANIDEAVALLAKVKNLDEETVRVSLTNENALATNNPILELTNESQQTTADILLELGEIKEKLDVTKIVDNSFIEQALQ